MFQGQIAIVTGGASGIGRQLCLSLARRGATVVVADIDGAAAEELAATLRQGGADASALTVDVAKQSEVARMIRATHEKYGRIDLLVNNAGVGLDGEFKDTTLDQWRHVIDVDLWGVIYGTHAVYPLMLAQGSGQIVNVASLAGLIPGGLMTSYGAAKHAVVGFSTGLRSEAALYGIKVNALCPGFIETSIQRKTPSASAYLDENKSRRGTGFFPTADKCVERMVRGIARNKAVIVSPATHLPFWWLYRLFPRLVPRLWKLIIRRIKRAASEV